MELHNINEEYRIYIKIIKQISLKHQNPITENERVKIKNLDTRQCISQV